MDIVLDFKKNKGQRPFTPPLPKKHQKKKQVNQQWPMFDLLDMLFGWEKQVNNLYSSKCLWEWWLLSIWDPLTLLKLKFFC